jgi:hypothetical protein
MMDDAFGAGTRPQRLFRASRTNSVCMERATRQPMIRRANTSITKAT